jgi:hypothetical protein
MGYPPPTPYGRFGNPSPPVSPGLVYQNAQGVYSNTTTPSGLASIGVTLVQATDVQTVTAEITGLLTVGSITATGTVSLQGNVTFAGASAFSSTVAITGVVTASTINSVALSNLVLGTASYGASLTFASATGIPQFNALTTNGVLTTTSTNGTLAVVGVTGTGTVVLSASPAFTGTANFVNLTSSGSIEAAGTILTSSPTGFGYAAGAGGAQTQSTNKSTAVTLNAACGNITLSNSALASATTASFTFTNSSIGANDFVDIKHVSGGTLGSYGITFTPAAGSCTVYVTNITSGSLSEAIVLKFVVIKAAIT